MHTIDRMFVTLSSVYILGASALGWASNVWEVARVIKNQKTHLPIHTFALFDLKKYQFANCINFSHSTPLTLATHVGGSLDPFDIASETQSFSDVTDSSSHDLVSQNPLPKIPQTSVPVKSNPWLEIVLNFKEYNYLTKLLKHKTQIPENCGNIFITIYSTTSTETHFANGLDFSERESVGHYIDETASYYGKNPYSLATKLVSFGPGIYFSTIMLGCCALGNFVL